MPRCDLTIAVTGLNANDNPGPGVAVLRALRASPDFQGKLIGLTYDTLDPGLYARDLQLDASYLIPYPSQGAEALLERLLYVHERTPIDVIIPNLDAELPAFISLQDELLGRGIHMFLPTREQFDQRTKVKLPELARRAKLDVPETVVISSAAELYGIHETLGFPVMLKGVFYGAQKASSLDEALSVFHKTVAKWGVPVIVQAYHPGEEFNIVAVGDGELQDRLAALGDAHAGGAARKLRQLAEEARELEKGLRQGRIDPDELRRAFSSKTKAIIINSPHNPTGSVLEEEDLAALEKIVKETAVKGVSESYFGFFKDSSDG